MLRAVIALLAATTLLGGCTTAPPITPAPTQPTPTGSASAPPADPTLGAPASTPAEPSPTSVAVDWLDPSLPVETRVAALLAEMTVDEKIGQMTLIEKDSIDPAGVADFLVGGVLSGGGGVPTPNSPEAWWEMVDGYQQAALGTRLGIPMIYGIDAVHGHGNAFGATVFPHNIGLGAAPDAELVRQIGRATALEMSATGIRWDFGPVLAVPQDARWGRTYEGFSEDPVIVEELGTAFIDGLQSAGLASDDAVLATAKHFVGDGGTVWGSSTTEGYFIDQGVTDVDDEVLRDIHLSPYRLAIDAGVRTVMTSFSSTRAGKVHGDAHLITDVLKGELGFTGFVVSDWGGIDQVDPDYEVAVARSISAGIDMAMVPYDAAAFKAAVRVGLDSGEISQARIDDAVSRVLRVKFEMGLFEHSMPPPGRGDLLGSADHRGLARYAVTQSVVLLKTGPDVLPLSRSASVVVAGPGADDIGLQSGGWTIEWQGAQGDIMPGTTILDALTELLDDPPTYQANGEFADGTTADVGVVVVSEPPYAEGEGDSATLALPPAEVALVEQMRDRVEQVVVVILSGRPVILDDILPSADAIVAAWLPGTEAGGVVDMLLGPPGEVAFTGVTPYTWPLTPEDAPRTGKERCDGALYPLGYGLDAAGALIGGDACP